MSFLHFPWGGGHCPTCPIDEPPLLLDLKNAFGEVHHNLIPEVLRYHHIPQHIQNMVQSLYCNFHTSILTTSYQIPFLKVGKGVLQGDCLSPLTFNLCFNTFIKYISDPMFTQFGFTTSTLSPLSRTRAFDRNRQNLYPQTT